MALALPSGQERCPGDDTAPTAYAAPPRPCSDPEALWPALETWAAQLSLPFRYPQPPMRLHAQDTNSLEMAVSGNRRWYQGTDFVPKDGAPWYQNPWHRDFFLPERPLEYSGPTKHKWAWDSAWNQIREEERARWKRGQ